jgi:hypothetical protein
MTTQKRVGELYFADKSVEAACPPLKAVITIMVEGHYEGKSLNDPEVRKLFTRDYLKESDWYQERLVSKQNLDIQLWDNHIDYLQAFLDKKGYQEEARRLKVSKKLDAAHLEREKASKADYLNFLDGTIGVQPMSVFSQ